MFTSFTLQTALKGPVHQMKLYPVNHFLYNQKGPLRTKFSVRSAKYVCCMMLNTETAVMLRWFIFSLCGLLNCNELPMILSKTDWYSSTWADRALFTFLKIFPFPKCKHLLSVIVTMHMNTERDTFRSFMISDTYFLPASLF